MFKLIKNKEDWKEYASIQESRTFPNPAKHVNIPKEFPCFDQIVAEETGKLKARMT
jgi:hypothetical protein